MIDILVKILARAIADPIETGSRRGAIQGAIIGAAIGAIGGYVWTVCFPGANLIGACAAFGIAGMLVGAVVGARLNSS